MRKQQLIYMSPKAKQSFLYNLLVNPKMRIWRHIILFFTIGVIAFNQALLLNQQSNGAFDDQVIWMGLVLVVAYLMVTYFNLFVLVPRYLLQKKYGTYLVVLTLSMLLVTITRTVEEYFIYTYFEVPNERTSYFNLVSLLDILSYLVINTICIAGASITILLKQWIIENRRVSEMENRRILSEVEQLKDQVNPSFLFNILNRTGILAQTDPDKASQMVMILSRLLRYQLYESNREKVLVSSEINFLTNYLLLEKMYSDKVDYTLTTEGDLNRTFVPPLLFIAFAQYAIEQVIDREETITIHFLFHGEGNIFTFTCRCPVAPGADFSRVEQRLRHLYGTNYSLRFISDPTGNDNGIQLQLNA